MSFSATAQQSRRSHLAVIVAALIAVVIALLLVAPGTAHASKISFVSDSTMYGTVSKSSVNVADGKKIGYYCQLSSMIPHC